MSSLPQHLTLPSASYHQTNNTTSNSNNNNTHQASPTPASPFNPRTHRHKRSQAILGDFGLGLFNINDSTSIPHQTASSTSIYHQLAPPLGLNTSEHNNNNNNGDIAAQQTIIPSASQSVPKEVPFTLTSNNTDNTNTNTANNKTSEEDNGYLDRHFNFNNRQDFTNDPTISKYAFPKFEDFHNSINNNTNASPTATYTTNFRKNLSSPIQLSNKLSQSSLRQKTSFNMATGTNTNIGTNTGTNTGTSTSAVPDAIIDLDYILSANVNNHNLDIDHETNFMAMDSEPIFNQEMDFLGSPAIAEEDDSEYTCSLADDIMDLNDLDAPSLMHQGIQQQQQQQQQLPPLSPPRSAMAAALSSSSSGHHQFYSLANSSASSINNNGNNNNPSTSLSNTPLVSTPTQQRSGARAHRYQIFYDQSNRISNALKGPPSMESISRQETPPLQTHQQFRYHKNNNSGANTATSNTTVAYNLNHSSSLPSLKGKRSFSSMRYAEFKRMSSPKREFNRNVLSMSPTKFNLSNAGNSSNNFGNHLGLLHGIPRLNPDGFHSPNHAKLQSHYNSAVAGGAGGGQGMGSNQYMMSPTKFNPDTFFNPSNNSTTHTIDEFEGQSNLNPRTVPQSSTPSTLGTQSTMETSATENSVKENRGKDGGQTSENSSPISNCSETSTKVVNNIDTELETEDEIMKDAPEIIITNDVERKMDNVRQNLVYNKGNMEDDGNGVNMFGGEEEVEEEEGEEEEENELTRVDIDDGSEVENEDQNLLVRLLTLTIPRISIHNNELATSSPSESTLSGHASPIGNHSEHQLVQGQKCVELVQPSPVSTTFSSSYQIDTKDEVFEPKQPLDNKNEESVARAERNDCEIVKEKPELDLIALSNANVKTSTIRPSNEISPLSSSPPPTTTTTTTTLSNNVDAKKELDRLDAPEGLERPEKVERLERLDFAQPLKSQIHRSVFESSSSLDILPQTSLENKVHMPVLDSAPSSTSHMHASVFETSSSDINSQISHHRKSPERSIEFVKPAVVMASHTNQSNTRLQSSTSTTISLSSSSSSSFTRTFRRQKHGRSKSMIEDLISIKSEASGNGGGGRATTSSKAARRSSKFFDWIRKK